MWSKLTWLTWRSTGTGLQRASPASSQPVTFNVRPLTDSFCHLIMSNHYTLSLVLYFKEKLEPNDQATLKYLFLQAETAPNAWPEHQFFRDIPSPLRLGYESFSSGDFLCELWCHEDGSLAGINLRVPVLQITLSSITCCSLTGWPSSVSRWVLSALAQTSTDHRRLCCSTSWIARFT